MGLDRERPTGMFVQENSRLAFSQDGFNGKSTFMNNKLSVIGTLLVLVLSGSLVAQSQPAGNTADSTVAPLTEEASSSQVATLTAVTVHDGAEGVGVEISCTRPVTPNAQMISDPTRLVLDFANTVSQDPENRIAVNQGGVKQVRIGVQPVKPPVTRVVLDLDQERSYQLVADGDKLIVRVGKPNTSPSADSANPQSSPDLSASAANSSGHLFLSTATMSSQEAASEGTDAASSLGALTAAHASLKSSDSAGQSSDQVTSAEKAQPKSTTAGQEPDPIQSSVARPPDPEPTGSADTSKAAPSSSPISSNSSAMPTPVQAAKPEPTQGDALDAKASTNAQEANLVPAAKLGSQPSPDVPSHAKAKDEKTSLPAPTDYVIGEEDVLTIVVWKERELSGQVVVRPDGKITLPLVNEIKVVGMTPAQLQAVLTEKLKPYVNVPQVTVEVNQINSRKVYLIGQVMKTGTFPVNSATTVLEIIAQAGGLRDFAKRKDIYILRKVGGNQQRYAFNYDDVIRGKKTQQNIVLQPGDMIVVP